MNFEYKNKTFDIEGYSETDHIYRTIVNSHCFYEIDLLEYMLSIKKHISKLNSVAIDVGANIGNHSIFFRSYLTEHLIAVEPNPIVASILERNLRNNIDNYSIYRNALGETEGKGSLAFPENAETNIGRVKIHQNDNTGTVEIVTLDSMVEDWSSHHGTKADISIIKIDVEGMEMAVLKGAEATIRKYRPHLFLEAATEDEFYKLKRYLNGLGYRDLCQWAATPVYHFAYNPPVGLMIRALWIKLRRILWNHIERLSK